MKDNQNKRRKLTDEQVEQMLARAVQKNVPDILQQAASTPVTPLAMVDEILPVQYPRRRPHWQRLAAACLMLLLTGAGIFSWLWFPTRAVVSIEVNPSVALSLNRFSYVINTRANNDDGAELLDDLLPKFCAILISFQPIHPNRTKRRKHDFIIPSNHPRRGFRARLGTA